MKGLNKPPTGFFVIGVLALVWNLFGVMAYIGQAYMTPDVIEGMDKAEIEFIQNTPAWVTAAFAFAVWGGFLGSLFLLLRKGFSFYLFVISMLGIVVQQSYNFFLAESPPIDGGTAYIMPASIILVGVFLIYYARRAKNKEWIS